MAVWWLGRRRWPGTPVPWIASLLTATGTGFIFMAAAPQAHAVAFAAFPLFLALCDRMEVWSAKARLSTWAKAGWMAGAAGLVYLVYIPCLLFVWLYGLAAGAGRLRARRLAGLVVLTAVALGIVAAWQVFGSSLLGLRFSGGNNDLAGEAVAIWLRQARQGAGAILDQFHNASPRGILGAAFYYPWWLLAAIGLVASPAEGRRWALAVAVAAVVPAIAFAPRFALPRIAYFAYPAVYLLAAAGIAALAQLAARRRTGRWPAAVVAALCAGLAVLANANLLGVRQLDLWFHYSHGVGW
jgi:hypothetical protein